MSAIRVSIPYERESTSERKSKKFSHLGDSRFNSLRTGKHI